MKILTTLLILSSLLANAQTKRLVEISKEYFTLDVPITDGMTYKYIIGNQNDTARYFNPGSDFYDVTVVFKKRGVVNPPADVIEDVDDRDSRIVYGTGWDKTCCTTDPNSPHFNRTIAWSCSIGSTFTFTFTGKSVTWFAEKMNTHAVAAVKFDNETTETKVDLYNGTKLTQQAIFTKNWPTVGEHKVTIRVTGEKISPSTNVCIVSDYFRIIK
jgi:hypothetical protein